MARKRGRPSWASRIFSETPPNDNAGGRQLIADLLGGLDEEAKRAQIEGGGRGGMANDAAAWRRSEVQALVDALRETNVRLSKSELARRIHRARPELGTANTIRQLIDKGENDTLE